MPMKLFNKNLVKSLTQTRHFWCMHDDIQIQTINRSFAHLFGLGLGCVFLFSYWRYSIEEEIIDENDYAVFPDNQEYNLFVHSLVKRKTWAIHHEISWKWKVTINKQYSIVYYRCEMYKCLI